VYISNIPQQGDQQMMVPYCAMCGETEVGTYTNSTEFCSEYCVDAAYADLEYLDEDQQITEQPLITENIS
jgi:endogenous inhibitor of DNA gyrase (YacG/DUF329 family)